MPTVCTGRAGFGLLSTQKSLWRSSQETFTPGSRDDLGPAILVGLELPLGSPAGLLGGVVILGFSLLSGAHFSRTLFGGDRPRVPAD